MRHLFRPALLLALTALLAAGSLHAMNSAPSAAAVAKLAPPVAAIAAASGTPQARTMMTRSLAEQQQPRGPAPLAARWTRRWRCTGSTTATTRPPTRACRRW